LIILATGLILTFILTPVYSFKTTIRVKDNHTPYHPLILEYFPSETRALLIYPKGVSDRSENKYLDSINSKLGSEAFLLELSDKVGPYPGKDRLKKIISLNRSNSRRTLTVNSVSLNKTVPFIINNNILELCIEEEQAGLSLAYQELLAEMDTKLIELSAYIDQKSAAPFEDLTKLQQEELESNIDIYNRIREARELIQENKDFYISRLEAEIQPSPEDTEIIFSWTNGVLFSFIISLSITLMIILITNYISESKKRPGS
jgi:hypothetical protein